MCKQNTVATLKCFREKMYHFFSSRQDASIEFVDALSSNIHAQSIVELSLNELYRRNYCSITRTLDEFYPSSVKESKEERNNQLTCLLASYCPIPKTREYYVFGVDCTPAPRMHSHTLKDRGFVHQPSIISTNKPITIGHEYSIMACLPEKLSEHTSPWIWPLSCHRVSTEEKNTMVGMKQINHVISYNKKFSEALCVSVADSAYSNLGCIYEANKLDNQVHVSRLKNNRVLYRSIAKKRRKLKKKKRGRPTVYGNRFVLKDKRTWGRVSEDTIIERKTKKGKFMQVHIQSWKDILMRGKKDIPMSEKAFRLIRIHVVNSQGKLMFKRPLWLLASGQKRNQLSLEEIYDIYRQRFDLEHFFRFGKNRLLMGKSQSPELAHEEACWQMAMLAYAQLFLCREIAHGETSKPWEKCLPQYKKGNTERSPTQVQRNFGRIIREIGTIANPLKPRKKSAGREKGEVQVKRKRYPVIRKGSGRLFKEAA